ncbi:MAG: hypothetical protein U1D55_04850 [Phycisphaerae bacterium]
MRAGLIASLLTLSAGVAQAGFQFTFDGIAPRNAAGIGAYMSGVYGSSVTVTDAFASNNAIPNPPAPGVLWNGNSSDYLRVGPNVGQRDFEITFDQRAIVSAACLGFVFDEARGPVDFTIRAYDASYTDRENPNASSLVFAQSFNVAHNGTQVTVGPIAFSRPVSLLVFSDTGRFDVGIDALTVAVPAPGAVVLGSLGLSLIGWLKRRVA